MQLGSYTLCFWNGASAELWKNRDVLGEGYACTALRYKKSNAFVEDFVYPPPSPPLSERGARVLVPLTMPPLNTC